MRESIVTGEDGINRLYLDGEYAATQGAWGCEFAGWHRTGCGDWATIEEVKKAHQSMGSCGLSLIASTVISSSKS